jgi:hypothetical protein
MVGLSHQIYGKQWPAMAATSAIFADQHSFAVSSSKATKCNLHGLL